MDLQSAAWATGWVLILLQEMRENSTGWRGGFEKEHQVLFSHLSMCEDAY